MSLNDNTSKIAAILAAANALPDRSEDVTLDTTLTQSGKAADAKAVGDALAEKADISDVPAALPNPNALTFTGAATGSYDGSAAMTVNIPSAVTYDHINSFIDAKLAYFRLCAKGTSSNLIITLDEPIG